MYMHMYVYMYICICACVNVNTHIQNSNLTSVADMRRTHELRVACTTPAPRIASTSRFLC